MTTISSSSCRALAFARPAGRRGAASVARRGDDGRPGRPLLDFKRRGRALRVVTKFPNLTREFFHRHGVTYFTLVGAEGALEAAPAMGYGDLIVDITETGVTLRDNHLKILEGGTVLRSQACLIGNRRALAASAGKRESVRHVLELCEARLRAQGYHVLTANIQGASAEAVAAHVIAQDETAGMQGPTIARVFPKDAAPASDGLAWFAVNLIIEVAAAAARGRSSAPRGGQRHYGRAA